MRQSILEAEYHDEWNDGWHVALDGYWRADSRSSGHYHLENAEAEVSIR